MASGPAIRRRRTFRCLVPRPRAHCRSAAGVALDPLETSELIDAAFSQASAAPARHRWASATCSSSTTESPCMQPIMPTWSATSAPPGYVRIRGSHRSQLLRSLKQSCGPIRWSQPNCGSPLAAFPSHPQARRRRTQRQRWAVHQKVPPELRSPQSAVSAARTDIGVSSMAIVVAGSAPVSSNAALKRPVRACPGPRRR